jgi:hypothetical protein
MEAVPGTFSRRKESQAPSPRFVDATRSRRVAAAATRLALEIGSRFDYPNPLNHSEVTVNHALGGGIGTGFASLPAVRDG